MQYFTFNQSPKSIGNQLRKRAVPAKFPQFHELFLSARPGRQPLSFAPGLSLPAVIRSLFRQKIFPCFHLNKEFSDDDSDNKQS